MPIAKPGAKKPNAQSVAAALATQRRTIGDIYRDARMKKR